MTFTCDFNAVERELKGTSHSNRLSTLIGRLKNWRHRFVDAFGLSATKMCLQVVLGLQLKVWLVYGNGLLP
jgi:hypothetical protein